MNNEVFLKTPLGIAEIKGDLKGVSSLKIYDEESSANIPSKVIPDHLQACVTQLQEYFLDKRTHFDLLLNPTGTLFQKKVWQELSKIPFGKTQSYLDIAKKLGDPNVIRAAATANGKNPLWVLIPCHRVIGNDGELRGYAGGIWRKKWLLDHESVYKQQSIF